MDLSWSEIRAIAIVAFAFAALIVGAMTLPRGNPTPGMCVFQDTLMECPK